MLMRSPESAKAAVFIAAITLAVAYVLFRRMAPQNPAPAPAPAPPPVGAGPS